MESESSEGSENEKEGTQSSEPIFVGSLDDKLVLTSLPNIKLPVLTIKGQISEEKIKFPHLTKKGRAREGNYQQTINQGNNANIWGDCRASGRSDLIRGFELNSRDNESIISGNLMSFKGNIGQRSEISNLAYAKLNFPSQYKFCMI